MLLFDSEGRIAFSDIMKSLKEHGIYESNNKVGSTLQSMSPNGIDIITKPNKGSRLYKLKWRYN